MKGVRQDFPRARLGPDLRRHCWTKAVTGAVPPRSISPVDRWTNAAGIVTGLFPPMPTRASHLLLPGVGTVGHPPAGALLKMIAALAPASFATDTFVLKVHTPRSISAILPTGKPTYELVSHPTLGEAATTSPEKVLYVGFDAKSETVEGRFPANALLVTYGW